MRALSLDLLPSPSSSSSRTADPVGPLVAALRAVAVARDLPEVMAAVLRSVRRLAAADGATFILLEGGGGGGGEGGMVHFADEDAIAPLWKGRRFPAEACISGVAILRRETLVIEDTRDDPRFPREAYRGTFVRSLALVPILRDAPLGAIGAYWARPHQATPGELTALEALAEAADLAVANADLRRRMERAVALRDEFIALAAHELNTPLAAVRLRADALARALRGTPGAPDPGPLTAALARLGETVSCLLESSRASGEGIALARERVDLAEVARRVVEGLRGRALACGTELVLRAEAVAGEWDGARLGRAVGHLVENAVKFGRGRPVEVVVSDEGNEGRVVVRDHGPGVAGPERQRIFEKFERAASPDHVGGLGIGLWMARAIAEAHGGTLRLEDAPASGASFVLRLPKRLPLEG